MRASTSSPPSSKPKSTATSSPAPSTPVTDANSTNTPDWDCLRSKESGGDYSIGGDEPYGGAYQAAVSTWQALGFSGVPNTSPRRCKMSSPSSSTCGTSDIRGIRGQPGKRRLPAISGER